MISLPISLLILVLVLAIIWWILTMIPVPPPLVWIVRVIFAIIALICVLSLLFGAWSFPFGHALR